VSSTGVEHCASSFATWLTQQNWQQFFELQSERQRDRFSGWGRYERRRGKRRALARILTLSRNCHIPFLKLLCGHEYNALDMFATEDEKIYKR
jgi:hypothetical protein